VIINNGELIKDVDGNDIHAHGGGIINVDGYFYWYGENRTGRVRVSCYRSKDLVNWVFGNHIFTIDTKFEQINELYDPTLIFDIEKVEFGVGANIERPKIIYNDITKKYVMWMHLENGYDYSLARCAIASCDTIDGDYVYHGSFNPCGYMSRDCMLFKEDKAYFISSSRENADLHLYRLSNDYLSVDEHIQTLWIDQFREAPVLFKKSGLYYMLTSGCTGWAPNQMQYAYAADIEGEWSDLIDVADKTTYDSQPFNVVEIKDQVYYLGDRWNEKNYHLSGYVFLPISINMDFSLSIPWSSSINLIL
jgi:hypothetical protein